MAVDEELHQQVVNRNWSPKCQLKVEPSTVIMHAQTDKIYHLKGQKTASRVVFLLGKRVLWLWMKNYINNQMLHGMEIFDLSSGISHLFKHV